MEKQTQPKEQKIFHRYYRSVEVCGRCNGEGKILVWPDADIFKLTKPKEEKCPLCEGSGMLQKTITTTIDLSPFKRE